MLSQPFLDLDTAIHRAVPRIWETGVDDGTRTHDDRDHNPGLYQLSYAHHFGISLLETALCGALGRTRTCNPRLRRPMLYPVELRAPSCISNVRLVGAEGFEPPTLCSQSRCATRLRHAPSSVRRNRRQLGWHGKYSLRRGQFPVRTLVRAIGRMRESAPTPRT